MLDMRTNNRTHDKKTRANDSYITPPMAMRALAAMENVPNVVWEPSAGSGAIVRALQESGRRVYASDLTRRQRSFDCRGGVDFLAQTELPDASVGAICTNPPFKHADAFIAKALELCPKVYLLLRVGYLAGLRWTNEVRGFGLHCPRVWVFSPRLPMMHRKNYKGPKNENSALDLAWYVFERDANAGLTGPRVGWVDWRNFATAAELEDVKRRRREAAADARARKREKELQDHIASGVLDDITLTRNPSFIGR